MDYVTQVQKQPNGTYRVQYIDVDREELKTARRNAKADVAAQILQAAPRRNIQGITIDENEEVHIPVDLPNRFKWEIEDKIIKAKRNAN